MGIGLLYMLSLRGYQKLVTVALAGGGVDVNMQGGRYGNMLQAASTRGHVEIVRQLFKYGANVNTQGGRWGNALYAAFTSGCTEIVQQLLEYGADANAQCRYFGNVLQAASALGFSEIVRQLLKYGADVNAQGGYYGSALYAASTGGYAEIVQQLLEQGADDVDAQRGQLRRRQLLERCAEQGANVHGPHRTKKSRRRDSPQERGGMPGT